jgi:inhibitor of cysteine peptidase
MVDDVMTLQDSIGAPQAMEKSAVSSDSSVSGSSGGSQDYSRTNTQVAGVDESDIVKTDGKYIYYMSDSYDSINGKQSKYVYIAKAAPADHMEVVRKIKIPDTFYNTDLYITDDKLVILSTGYNQQDYSRYWINRNQRTFVMVFDKTDVSSLKLQKLYVVDGDYTKSRKIGNTLYVVSNNYINFPYYAYPTVK